MSVKLSLATVWILTWAAMLSGEIETRPAMQSRTDFPPVEDILERLERDFELFDSGYSASHRGIDVAVTIGEEIRSPVSGQIHFSGFVVNRPVVSVIDSQGELYAFEPACSPFLKGERVFTREVIAEVCAGDDDYRHCPETCLHISLRVSGFYLSPLARFDLLEPSRLYPINRVAEWLQARG